MRAPKHLVGRAAKDQKEEKTHTPLPHQAPLGAPLDEEMGCQKQEHTPIASARGGSPNPQRLARSTYRFDRLACAPNAPHQAQPKGRPPYPPPTPFLSSTHPAHALASPHALVPPFPPPTPPHTQDCSTLRSHQSPSPFPFTPQGTPTQVFPPHTATHMALNKEALAHLTGTYCQGCGMGWVGGWVHKPPRWRRSPPTGIIRWAKRRRRRKKKKKRRRRRTRMRAESTHSLSLSCIYSPSCGGLELCLALGGPLLQG